MLVSRAVRSILALETLAGLCLLVVSAPRPAAAQIVFPSRARAAVHIVPERVLEQSTNDRAFGLRYLLDLYAAPGLLGARAELFTLYTLQTARGFVPMGVTRGNARLGADFEKLRDAQTGSASGHALYTYRSGDAGRVALIGRQEIAEGSEEALRVGLRDPGRDADSRARRELEESLRRLEDTGAAATLVYMAPPEGSNLVQVVRDLGAIWGPQLAKSIEPYEAVLGLLGSMRAGRADVWEERADLGVRIVLVAMDEGAAKRSHFALRTARGLAPMASKAAVRAGSMSQEDADVLARVLQEMQSRLEEDRIYIRLAVPASVVQ